MSKLFRSYPAGQTGADARLPGALVYPTINSYKRLWTASGLVKTDMEHRHRTALSRGLASSKSTRWKHVAQARILTSLTSPLPGGGLYGIEQGLVQRPADHR
jgi:hypothetical protein